MDDSRLMNIGGRLAEDGHTVRPVHLVEILARSGEDGPQGGVPVARSEVVR
ncbi:hypothetical protein ACWES4_09715 [Streptomyces sp. NPDC004011]